MRYFTFFLLLLALNPAAFAGKAAIFSGDDVRLLKSNLDLAGAAKILTGTQDPSVTATDAVQGSLFLRVGPFGGVICVKQDNGLTTNWNCLSSTGATLVANEYSNPSGGTLVGARNGVNKSYTISNPVVAGGLLNAHIDGVMIDPSDWTIVGQTLTFGAGVAAPAAFQTVSINYQYGAVPASTAIAEYSNPSGGTLVGARNGVNKVFTISNVPAAGQLFNVFIDGVMLDPSDWTLVGTTVTLGAGITAPAAFQSVLVNYQF